MEVGIMVALACSSEHDSKPTPSESTSETEDPASSSGEHATRGTEVLSTGTLTETAPDFAPSENSDPTVTGASTTEETQDSSAASTSTPSSSCPEGTLGCFCRPKGKCDPGLTCFNAKCLDLEAPCPFTNDGVCQEPDPCPVGTDLEDCAGR
jgi:hypothetical protein